GATVSYTYDEFGRKQRVTAPSGSTEYNYDQYGRLTSVTDAVGNETHYTFDEHGNKASTIYPNGTLTEYGYDNLNRLISVETRNISGTALASYNYTLNSKGQRTHVEEGVGGQVHRSIDYEYDAADRLIEERISDPVLGSRTLSYDYDPVGNRLTKNDNGVIAEYSYDDNDRLLTENGYSYTYDHNGNMLTKSGNGEQWQLEYNAMNQVTRANISRPQGASVIDYAYDHDGIRIGKTVNGTDITNYVADKNRPYAQVLEEEHLRGGLSAVTSYVYGDALISSTIDGTLTHYYHTDGMGSVRGLSDSSGAMTDSYSYDAYGMLTGNNGTSANSYLYRGEQYDSDLDAYYLRARYYQPEIGRFLTTDPVEGFPTAPISLHRYVYGNNAPTNFLDPSGKFSLMETLQAGAIVMSLNAGAMAGIAYSGWQDTYAALGEYIFPDAFVLGANIYGSANLGFWASGLLKMLPIGPHVMAGKGAEVLFSVSSGEIGIYETSLVNVALGFAEPLQITLDIYKGAVWNLWNAKDYEGPFHAFSFSLGKTFGSAGGFWDAKRGSVRGAWGVGRTFMSAGWPNIFPDWGQWTFALSRVNYKMFKFRETLHPTAAVAAIITTNIACYAVENWVKKNNMGDVYGLGLLMFETSIWVQTGVAKHYW
ncbi:MAG: RHS repeat protein, partial [bacterium]|nr:RHS repeat protein [bacterium]